MSPFRWWNNGTSGACSPVCRRFFSVRWFASDEE